MRRSVSPLTQIRSTTPSARWQLWLNSQRCRRVNHHSVFHNYLMNSGGKVVPLRKTQLLWNCMTKEKRKSLPARAWTANVLTHPAASDREQTDLGAVLSFPSGVGSSSPTFWARRCSGLGHLFRRAACCSRSGVVVSGPLQRGCEARPVMEEKDFCLGFLRSLFCSVVIKVTFSLPSVGF